MDYRPAWQGLFDGNFPNSFFNPFPVDQRNSANYGYRNRQWLRARNGSRDWSPFLSRQLNRGRVMALEYRARDWKYLYRASRRFFSFCPVPVPERDEHIISCWIWNRSLDSPSRLPQLLRSIPPHEPDCYRRTYSSVLMDRNFCASKLGGHPFANWYRWDWGLYFITQDGYRIPGPIIGSVEFGTFPTPQLNRGKRGPNRDQTGRGIPYHIGNHYSRHNYGIYYQYPRIWNRVATALQRNSIRHTHVPELEFNNLRRPDWAAFGNRRPVNQRRGGYHRGTLVVYHGSQQHRRAPSFSGTASTSCTSGETVSSPPSQPQTSTASAPLDTTCTDETTQSSQVIETTSCSETVSAPAETSAGTSTSCEETVTAPASESSTSCEETATAPVSEISTSCEETVSAPATATPSTGGSTSASTFLSTCGETTLRTVTRASSQAGAPPNNTSSTVVMDSSSLSETAPGSSSISVTPETSAHPPPPPPLSSTPPTESQAHPTTTDTDSSPTTSDSSSSTGAKPTESLAPAPTGGLPNPLNSGEGPLDPHHHGHIDGHGGDRNDSHDGGGLP
ncbi:hypothetical protein B0I37DRAFT_411249 [Chaetomium sp. MPI-CAGE-AT-0009]|nr:hypothetical protein B0I37DRAFT_411249 [Chaetomium sp. MPI-CAGE-AT-0009]